LHVSPRLADKRVAVTEERKVGVRPIQSTSAVGEGGAFTITVSSA
jgi:hypothetical protein